MLQKIRIQVCNRSLGQSIGRAGLALCLMVGIGASNAAAKSFNIKKLPIGKNVTLLRPATTLVPMAIKAKLAATDVPQTVSFKAIWKGKKSKTPKNIKLAIYDVNLSRVRYVNIKTGVPFLYSFKGLASITVIPESASGGTFGSVGKHLRLQIESDKPLSIGR